MDHALTATPSQDEQLDIGDEELGRILLARKQVAGERLSGLENQQVQLAAKIERERKLIDHVDALLRDLGLVQEPPQPALGVSSNGTQPTSSPGKAFVAGNQSEKMPERRPEFATVSLIDAAKRLLDSGKTMDVDELTHAIYDIGSVEQLHAAKGNLRSAMANGVHRGWWNREKAGTFRMVARGPEE